MRQLSTLLRNGVPLVKALDTLASGGEDAVLIAAVAECSHKVQRGTSLSAACGQAPHVFPELFVTMIRLGERTGELDRNLVELADWLERDEALKRKVWAALTYPGLIMSVALMLTLALFRYVLPGLLTVLRELNAPLPLVTRVVMALSDFLQSFWALPALLIGLAACWHGGRWVLRQPQVVVHLYELLLQVPVLGSLLQASSTARYSFALRSMANSGADQIYAYELAARISGNPLYQQDSAGLRAGIREGIVPSQHMAQRRSIYPTLLTQMVSVGEETGQMAPMLDRASHLYSLELEAAVEILSASLEPLLMVAVAGLVATLLLSIFLPLYSYLGSVGA